MALPAPSGPSKKTVRLSMLVNRVTLLWSASKNSTSTDILPKGRSELFTTASSSSMSSWFLCGKRRDANTTGVNRGSGSRQSGLSARLQVQGPLGDRMPGVPGGKDSADASAVEAVAVGTAGAALGAAAGATAA